MPSRWMNRGRVRNVLVAWGCLILGGCAPGQYRHAGSADADDSAASGRVELPPDATTYTTASGSEGVRGGASASEAKALLEQELAARGDEPEPDAALAATAAWLLRNTYAREPNSSTTVTQAAQRFGFAGMIHGSLVGSLAEERTHT